RASRRHGSSSRRPPAVGRGRWTSSGEPSGPSGERSRAACSTRLKATPSWTGSPTPRGSWPKRRSRRRGTGAVTSRTSRRPNAGTGAWQANPTGATLAGTTTVNAVDGIATLADLSVDRPGSGYTLAATASGLTGATSTTFAVHLTFATVSAGDNHTCGLTASH